MSFSAIVQALGRSRLSEELLLKLKEQRFLDLCGVPRFPKGLVASALAQQRQQHLFVVTATLEEAGRWATQLEAMGWQTVYFYPTSEASPYESLDRESEMIWGQLQVLAETLKLNANPEAPLLAIVTTERALQPHLPPVQVFEPYCLSLETGIELDLKP